MKMICILPEASDASLYITLKNLQKDNIELRVFAFERNIYKGKLSKNDYQSLGIIQNQQYFQRIKYLVKAIPKLTIAAKEADVFFVLRGLDLLIIVWIACILNLTKPRILYQVADIQTTMLGSSRVSQVLRWIERFIVKQIDLIVTTSEAYISGYFVGVQGLDNLRFHLIENKVDSTMMPLFTSKHRQRQEGHFRIGYFGLLRCRQSWEVLQRVVEQGEGRISVYMRGVVQGLENVDEITQSSPYIDYGGPYLNPDELPQIFDEVDIVWAAVYHAEANIRWSRVHRFYQACFFKSPLISQLNTQDGKVVNEKQLGVCVDLVDIQQSVDQILKINENEFLAWKRNMDNLPPELFLLTNEYQVLLDKIQCIVDRRAE